MYLSPVMLLPVYGLAVYFSYGFRLTYLAPRGIHLFILSSIILWLGSAFGALLAARWPRKVFRLVFAFAAAGYFIFPHVPFLGSFFMGMSIGSFWTVLTAHFMMGPGHGKRSGFVNSIATLVSFAVALLWGNLLSTYTHRQVSVYYGLFVLLLSIFPLLSDFSYSRGFKLHKIFLIQYVVAFLNIFGSLQGIILFETGLSKPASLGAFIAASSIVSALLSYLLGHLTDEFGGRKEAIRAFAILFPPFFLYMLNYGSVYGLMLALAFINSIGTIIMSLVLALQADLGLKGIECMAFRQVVYALGAATAFLFAASPTLLAYSGIAMSLLLVTLL